MRAGQLTLCTPRSCKLLVRVSLCWRGALLCLRILSTLLVLRIFSDLVQSMPGLRIDDCNDVLFLGVFDEYNIPNPMLDPPSTTTDQTANVVITGDSTGIVFKNVEVGEGPGMSPRVLSAVDGTAHRLPCSQYLALNFQQCTYVVLITLSLQSFYSRTTDPILSQSSLCTTA